MHSTKSYNWTTSFREIYDRVLERYQNGNRELNELFSEQDCKWLSSIGCRKMEIYDFAEDYPDLDSDTALLITAARRDYFFDVQKCRHEGTPLDPAVFPPKSAELGGIPWLPRIILKARAKLRGELPDELMYCCGGDRKFLKEFDIHPADFLRLVQSAGDNDNEIVEFLKAV